MSLPGKPVKAFILLILISISVSGLALAHEEEGGGGCHCGHGSLRLKVEEINDGNRLVRMDFDLQPHKKLFLKVMEDGKMKDFGESAIECGEFHGIWDVVEENNLVGRKFKDEEAGHGDTVYTIFLRNHDEENNFVISSARADSDAGIKKLIGVIETLAEKYSKQ